MDVVLSAAMKPKNNADDVSEPQVVYRENLEPVMRLEITAPQECVDGVLFTLMGRRADIQSEEHRDCVHIIHAEVPMAEMIGYASELRIRTQGRATYSMRLDRYQPPPQGTR